MKKSIEELYQKAKRLNDVEFYQGEEYQEAASRQMELYVEMRTLFGPSFGRLMEEYSKAVGQEMELECRRFFQQGYLAGCSGVKGR